MAIRYKTFGKQEYAYEIWNEKNTETGKWAQRSKYLGVVVDKEKGIYEKRSEAKRATREAALKEQGCSKKSCKRLYAHKRGLTCLSHKPLSTLARKVSND